MYDRALILTWALCTVDANATRTGNWHRRPFSSLPTSNVAETRCTMCSPRPSNSIARATTEDAVTGPAAERKDEWYEMCEQLYDNFYHAVDDTHYKAFSGE